MFYKYFVKFMSIADKQNLFINLKCKLKKNIKNLNLLLKSFLNFICARIKLIYKKIQAFLEL